MPYFAMPRRQMLSFYFAELHTLMLIAERDFAAFATLRSVVTITLAAATVTRRCR